jgi:hypothetical protein
LGDLIAMMKPLTILAILATAGAASACGSLGPGKGAPDEFRVVTKAPLVIPPDYALRPPRPGDPRPQELRPDEDARTALFGQDIGAQASEGEKLLVSQAGAGAIDPNIRDKVDLESAALVRKNSGLSDRILGFGKDGAKEDATPLDAAAEKARLEREEQVRRAAGAGPVVIEREDSGGFKLPGL